MARCLSTTFIATILVLVNFVLVSSALRSYDVREIGEEIFIFTEDDIVSEEKTTRHLEENLSTRFIGDLVVGNRRPNEQLYQNSFVITNPTSVVYSKQLSFSAKGTIHYLSVLNEPASYVVACETPYTLGSSITKVNVRVVPNSRSTITVLAATH